VEEQTTEKTTARKAAGPAGNESPADKDLSTEIERVIEREPLDQVRCVRVFGNYYRCNWWSRLGGPRVGLDYDWAGLLKDFIRQSRFLTATMEAGQLVVKEVPTVAAYQNGGSRTHLLK
jgi:hypothetical protein